MIKEKLPNFFILGAPKCGTSSLYHYMLQHPQVYLPKDKEPHFFDHDIFYQEGADVYVKRHFSNAKDYPLRGDATPGYFRKPDTVIPRMQETYKGKEIRLKFILIFRNPVRRAWSHYLHQVRNSMEERSFKEALEIEQKQQRSTKENNWNSYFSDGLYARLLSRWFKTYDKEQFLIFLTKDLKEDRRKVCSRIFSFLDVDPEVEIDVDVQRNVASKPRSRILMRFLSSQSKFKIPFKALLSRYQRKRVNEFLRRLNLRPYDDYPKLNKDIKKYLQKKYRPDILKLEGLINRDLSSWLNDAK